MIDMLGFGEPLVVNVVGHGLGVLLFGVVAYLIWFDNHSRTGMRWLPAGAAMLALLWNLGSLAGLIAGHYGWPGRPTLTVISIVILSVLPAMLLRLSLSSELPYIVKVGNALAAVSVIAHICRFFLPGLSQILNSAAVWTITLGFAILTAAAMLLLPRQSTLDRSARPRLMAAMSLFLFAISVSHFGSRHGQVGWATEVLFHHAGIPLALFILLQDYRFLMLDAFLRFLLNAGLASLFTVAPLAVAIRFHLLSRASSDPLLQLSMLLSVCLMLFLFVWTRSRLQGWLTRAAFGRPPIEPILHSIEALGANVTDEAAFVGEASELVRGYACAEGVSVFECRDRLCTLLRSAVLAGRRANSAADWPTWAQVSVPIRLSHGGHLEIHLGRRRGGRRYLSEDLDALDQLAGAIVLQLEHLRNQEMQKLVSSAELRLLQAQINPHFLFNALNALYGSIPRTAAAARQTVLNLADVLRYSLQPEKALLPLSEELRIVEAYLDIESLRLGNRLTKKISVDDGALGVSIPMLSLQPLVENAVKHGIAAGRGPGIVSVEAKVFENGLRVSVEDSANGLREGAARNPGCGVALDNVRRRLAICYGADCELKTWFSPTGSRVEFEIPFAMSKVDAQDDRGFAPTVSA